MKPQSEEEVSRLLQAWSDGDQSALERLAPIIYDELRSLARYYLKGERPSISLQTTAPVNEAYLRPDEAHTEFLLATKELENSVGIEHKDTLAARRLAESEPH
jgi:ECF sigma factor